MDTSLITAFGLTYVKAGVFMLGGFAVAGLVESAAQSVFKPQSESVKKTIKWTAFLIGVGLTACYAPQVLIVKFTAEQALQCLAAELLVCGLISLCARRFIPLFGFGSLTGLIGGPTLPAAWAALGAWHGAQS